MKTTIKQALIGAAAVLAMAGANAETISLIPSSINVGAPIELTVAGSGFNAGVSAGTVTVGWDPAVLEMTSTALELAQSAASYGFSNPFRADINDVSGFLQATFTISFLELPQPGPTFNFFDIAFAALLPTQTAISLGSGPDGFWQDGSVPVGQDITGVSYVGATVNVPAEVPLPAAAWLFGSGLLGLAGIARRRSAQAQS